MPTLHFVCYGNICRSPFAEYYARLRAEKLGLSGWRFTSSGVGASPGTGTPKPGLTAAREHGVDLAAHRARRVADDAPSAEDVVIAMDRYVFGVLAENMGTTLADVQGPGGSTLRLMMQELVAPGSADLDVPDPMGQGVSAYQTSYAVLVEAVDALLDRLAG